MERGFWEADGYQSNREKVHSWKITLFLHTLYCLASNF